MDATDPQPAAAEKAPTEAEAMVGTPEGRRAIECLWNPQPAPAGRGPRPRKSLAEVVDAGVAIADAEGLEALSIRKVAARLGIGAMSVYTYVPGRSELIELMIDRVYGEHGIPDPALGWRARIEEWMRSTWRIYNDHPWLLDHNMARLPVGPHVLDVEEALYAAVYAAGFGGAENVTVSNLLRWQLIGAARSMISDAAEERHTGVSAEAYWESRSSFWSTYFDEARFPTMAAIWASGGFDDPAGYDIERMITWLLDGIERLADSR
ncbi:MAG TPA: TetR/AcrR family transcriptional regulator C-terminal domain-containing protein [Propionibacteriaceae bacterium]|nr:TetR/AcrR family transcriptional regulator C-terminal domain-containing protein [Propionibacteriaceae bacterium]